jgi:hypothetical protein
MVVDVVACNWPASLRAHLEELIAGSAPCRHEKVESDQ